MAAPQIDKKQVIEIFKVLNMGGIAAVVVCAIVVSFMWGTGCGPIRNSNNYGAEQPWGTPIIEDHPEAAAVDDGHQDDHGDHGDDHADEAH